MNFYYYLFGCAYWTSIHDLKEKSTPQEYAFLFISIVDVLFIVIVMGLGNLLAGQNLLNAGIVILVCATIAAVNYLIFLRDRKYVSIVNDFKEISQPGYKRKRVGTLVLTFLIVGLLAIAVAALNNSDFSDWLESK